MYLHLCFNSNILFQLIAWKCYSIVFLFNKYLSQLRDFQYWFTPRFFYYGRILREFAPKETRYSERGSDDCAEILLESVELEWIANRYVQLLRFPPGCPAWLKMVLLRLNLGPSRISLEHSISERLWNSWNTLFPNIHISLIR